MGLIQRQKSIIPACDVDSLSKFRQLAKAMAGIEGIEAMKVGLGLTLPFGVAEQVRMIRDVSDAKIIYDHQKAGNDIPEMGIKFAKFAVDSYVDAVILFPFVGPATETEWIKSCQGEGLIVLVGGHMTHPKFLASEGGFIADDAPERIYKIAAALGVRNFVVPGNKVEFVAKYRALLEKEIGPGGFTLYAPGFVKQGGVISDTGKVAGPKFHAIVGTGIYAKEGVEAMRAAAKEMTSQIL